MKNFLILLFAFFTTNIIYSQAVIIDTLNQCQDDTVTLTCVVPITGPGGLILNCDSIVDAHLFLVNVPQNANDSIQTWWDVNFSFIVVEPISFMFPPNTFTESGCYRFNVILNCISGGTLTLSSTRYISTVGITELNPKEKTIIRITDLMGKECTDNIGNIQILHFSDGTCKKVIKVE